MPRQIVLASSYHRPNLEDVVLLSQLATSIAMILTDEGTHRACLHGGGRPQVGEVTRLSI